MAHSTTTEFKPGTARATMAKRSSEMRSAGNCGVSDARTKPTHASPESWSSRSAMASTSVKGRVCTTQKPTEFYVCRQANPHAEVHDHSIPNFTITKGVGLWARTHLKKEDRTDTLPGRDSSLIKLVTRLFQADCHNRPRWCQLKGLCRGAGLDTTPHSGSRSVIGASVADAHH